MCLLRFSLVDEKNSDSVTRTQDFIIGPVQGRQQVYTAFGGSFHGWKFLPNIGKHVIDSVDGQLPQAWQERWNGYFETEEKAHVEVVPNRSFPGP
jgi:glycine/D-amino acid oxidase-like deaminating enzyme